MTKLDIVELFAIISGAYPRDSSFAASNDDHGVMMVETWYAMLGDLSVATARAALQKHIAKSQWPPSIAELRQEAVSILNPETRMTEDEAWGYVSNAVRKYGYYQQKEARESMPPEIWQIVQSIGYGEICLATRETMSVIRGQFGRMWKAVSERKREDAALPESLKAQIAAIGQMPDLKLIHGGLENA